MSVYGASEFRLVDEDELYSDCRIIPFHDHFDLQSAMKDGISIVQNHIRRMRRIAIPSKPKWRGALLDHLPGFRDRPATGAAPSDRYTFPSPKIGSCGDGFQRSQFNDILWLILSKAKATTPAMPSSTVAAVAAGTHAAANQSYEP